MSLPQNSNLEDRDLWKNIRGEEKKREMLVRAMMSLKFEDRKFDDMPNVIDEEYLDVEEYNWPDGH